MKLSRRSRWILCFASAPVAGIALYLFLWPDPVGSPPANFVSVKFNGYTNDVQGQTLARFQITNRSRYRIDCSIIGAMMQVTNRSQISTNIQWQWLAGYNTNLVLQPGEVSEVIALTPTNAVPWKLGGIAEKPMNRYKRVVTSLQPWLPRRVYWVLQDNSRDSEFFQSHLFQVGTDERSLETMVDGS